MTCDDAVLELSDPGGPSAGLAGHLAGCEACRETARVLALAALPPATAADQAALAGLAGSALAAWTRQERTRAARRRGARQLARLALAAGVGALVASGALLLRPHPAPPTAATRPELAANDESYLLEDEVFFDVSWPEGDL
jgi:predicted anti-sigma-YlaC factor YlaD